MKHFSLIVIGIGYGLIQADLNEFLSITVWTGVSAISCWIGGLIFFQFLRYSSKWDRREPWAVSEQTTLSYQGRVFQLIEHTETFCVFENDSDVIFIRPGLQLFYATSPLFFGVHPKGTLPFDLDPNRDQFFLIG